MKPLIDSDVLRYEIGFCGQSMSDDGELSILSWDLVQEMLDQRIKEICAEVWATEPPLIFLSKDKVAHRIDNRRRLTEERELKFYKPNFREKVAVTKPYKGTRKQAKPFHYANITNHLMTNYDHILADGIEADDALSIYQYAAEPLTTIICSRDKDLRITPGMHFGWPCGKQRQFGPTRVDELGEIKLVKTPNGDKIVGTGLKFFFSQCITGDAVDNIPGLPRRGPVYAEQLLSGCQSEEECLHKVVEAYRERYEDEWFTHLDEQAKLLWMVRELDEEGNPIPYDIKGKLGETI